MTEEGRATDRTMLERLVRERLADAPIPNADEGTILRLAQAYQNTTEWHTRPPAAP